MELLVALIAGLGMGTVITATVQYLLNKRELAFTSQRQDLEKRYRVIILLMYAAYEFDDNKAALRINRPDLSSREDVLKELKAEWYNMLLFASENTQIKLHAFINSPELGHLNDTAISMRNDLGRGKIGSVLGTLKFEE